MTELEQQILAIADEMKHALPIKIEALPDTATSPALWRQIAPVLQAIADSESRNADLYRDERIAYNAIAFANWKASKRQWLELWQYLLERKVLQIGEVAAPKPKPSTPKKQRPTSPPKNVKPKKKPKRKSPFNTRFVKLKTCLLHLQVYLWFGDFAVYSAPLCRSKKNTISK